MKVYLLGVGVKGQGEGWADRAARGAGVPRAAEGDERRAEDLLREDDEGRVEQRVEGEHEAEVRRGEGEDARDHVVLLEELQVLGGLERGAEQDERVEVEAVLDVLGEGEVVDVLGRLGGPRVERGEEVEDGEAHAEGDEEEAEHVHVHRVPREEELERGGEGRGALGEELPDDRRLLAHGHEEEEAVDHHQREGRPLRAGRVAARALHEHRVSVEGLQGERGHDAAGGRDLEERLHREQDLRVAVVQREHHAHAARRRVEPAVLPVRLERRGRARVRGRRRGGRAVRARPRGEVEHVRARAVGVEEAVDRRVLLRHVLSREREAGQAAVPAAGVRAEGLARLGARAQHAVAGAREAGQARRAAHVRPHAPLLDAHGAHEGELTEHQVRGHLGVVGRASRVEGRGGEEGLLQRALQPRPRLRQRRDPIEGVPIACATHRARVVCAVDGRGAAGWGGWLWRRAGAAGWGQHLSSARSRRAEPPRPHSSSVD